MIKIFGAIFLLGGATVIGFLAANELTVRVRVLSGFLSALSVMRSEIGERLTPIPELLDRLSKNSAPPLDAFFLACHYEKEQKADTQLSVIWLKNLRRAEYLKLKQNEKEVISEIGAVLGRYGADEQLKSLSQIMRRVETLLESAEADKKRLGSVYTKLGFVCGMAMVIIFI